MELEQHFVKRVDPVRLFLSPFAEYIKVNVGIGFDISSADQLFKPFHRLVGKSEYDSSGMGLAICQKIAERHRGSITGESEPGGGSTFCVTLPMNPNQ